MVNITQLLEIGIAMAGEKDVGRLLMTTLTAAMDITNCDGGTIYLLQEEALHFRVMITNSLHVCLGDNGEVINMPPVPLSSDKHVCSTTANAGMMVNIPDVYENTRFDFSGTRKYDAFTGYRTTSLLCVPMKNDRDELIGVLQLLNAQDEAGGSIPFDPSLETMVQSLSTQAAICLTNINYSVEVITLLNSLVRVTSTAIDARSPYNANHTRNMVKYGERFLRWLDSTENEWQLNEPQKQEFIMSIWLHDVGKLVVPLEVMNKDSRLGIYLNDVEHRFEIIGLNNQLNKLSGQFDEDAFAEAQETLAGARELIQFANKAPFLNDEELSKISALGDTSYADSQGQAKPYLLPEEVHLLLVQKGTLTAEERLSMEDHVVMTSRILNEMPFPKRYGKVPDFATAHHEFLDGTGYPNHLMGDQIPKEVRLLTILDIFDALTARDRPYKPPMPVEKAFDILDSLVAEGKLDGDILALFKQSNAFDEPDLY